MRQPENVGARKTVRWGHGFFVGMMLNGVSGCLMRWLK
jgi:lipoprotein